MKALLLREDIAAMTSLARVLSAKGFQVFCVETRHTARAMLRLEIIDLLIMDERMGGALTHSVALSAERANPYINQILLTDRPGVETDDLFELIPSLYSLAGPATPAAMLAKLALSSIESFEQAKRRVERIITWPDGEWDVTATVNAPAQPDGLCASSLAMNEATVELPRFRGRLPDIECYAANQRRPL